MNLPSTSSNNWHSAQCTLLLKAAICVFPLLAAFAFLSSAEAQQVPEGWRRPTRAETPQKWRMKSVTRFLSVKGDFDGDGKPDLAELLIKRSVSDYALFVWLSSSRSRSPQSIWEGGLANIGIKLVHPGRYETLCNSDPSECDPRTPTKIDLKNDGVEFFSYGMTRSFVFWDKEAKKFQWVPIGD